MRPWIVGCLVAALAAGTTPVAAAIDETLRATLLQMGRDDQEATRVATADPTRQLNEAERIQNDTIHRTNAQLIRRIVEERGWPGISLVGADGASAAWVVVQHMDDEPEFQRSCLALMEKAFETGEVRPQELAYLTDRVLTHEGKRQMYGTQGRGVMSPQDEARIDTNRAAIGLPPWRVAVEQRQKVYANGYGGAVKPRP